MSEMRDQDIVQKLLERDSAVTYMFFYIKCRPLFLSLMRRFYNYPINYDEFVSIVTNFLYENGEQRLRQFKFESTICCWLRTCLIRHFLRNKKELIDDTSKESIYSKEESIINPYEELDEKIDLEILLKQLAKKNERYYYIVRRLFIEDASYEDLAKELNTQISNLYNIKKRAITELTKIVLKDVK